MATTEYHSTLPPLINHRNPDTHKGDYGHALLIAGSYCKMGAALLAARACMRAGAGLLTVHLPLCGIDIMQGSFPEAMISPDGHPHHFADPPEDLERYSAIAVGPGLGTHDDTRQALARLLGHCHRPLILDADALNIIARDHLLHLVPKGTIITPHAKEYQRLFDDADAVQMAQEHSLVIVQKAHHTRVISPDGDIYVNHTGNAGMATAGSGDVLTGIILGLATQGLDPYTAATTGVFLHGKSADIAIQKQSQSSLIASDIIKNLRHITE